MCISTDEAEFIKPPREKSQLDIKKPGSKVRPKKKKRSKNPES